MTELHHRTTRPCFRCHGMAKTRRALARLLRFLFFSWDFNEQEEHAFLHGIRVLGWWMKVHEGMGSFQTAKGSINDIADVYTGIVSILTVHM